MPEELNQVQDMSLDDDTDLFADFDGEDDGKPAEETEESETVSETESEVKEETEKVEDSSEHPEDFLEITYNKEARKLTKDETIALAQKGMNYDNIYGRYTSLKDNEPRISQLSKLAEANNMTLDEYIENLNAAQSKFELNREVEELKKLYPNSDEKLIEEMAKVHMNDRSTSLMAQRQAEEKAQKEAIGKQIDDFTRRYPDMDVRQVAGIKEVKELMQNGHPLTEAYLIYREDQRVAQEKITRQNEENKKRSLGSTTNTGYSEEDEFIKELFSD